MRQQLRAPREGVTGLEDVAIVGGAAEVGDRLQAMAAAGVTDFAASEFVRSPGRARSDPRTAAGVRAKAA